MTVRAGLASALAMSASLVLAEPSYAHGDATPLSELPRAWSLEPSLIAAAAISVALYARAFIRLRRRGRADHARPWRAAAFCAGVGLILLALTSPLDAAGEEYLLSAHMLQHMLIGDLGAALTIAGLRGPMSLLVMPAPLLRVLARGAPRAVGRTLARPGLALGLWAAVFALWHVPALYDAALRRPPLHKLEHVCFIAAGLLVWYQLLDPAGHRQLRQKATVFVGVLAAGQILSLTLLASFDAYYPAYAHQDERLFGLSALTDQRLAGAVMMVEQFLTLGAFLYATLRGRFAAQSLPGNRASAASTQPQDRHS